MGSSIGVPYMACMYVRYLETRNRAENTPNIIESIGKYFRKWLNTWIMAYFGDQNYTEIGPLRPIFNTPLNVNQDLCETSGKCLTKWPKTGSNFGLLRPIFSTPVKVLTMSMWNQWKPFEKMNFYLFWGPKWPPLRSIFHTSLKVLAMRRWSNTDVKPVNIFFRKWPKTGNST